MNAQVVYRKSDVARDIGVSRQAFQNNYLKRLPAYDFVTPTGEGLGWKAESVMPFIADVEERRKSP